MHKIGFFIGHAQYIPHARLLCASILEKVSFGATYKIIAMTPAHLGLELNIPGLEQVNFEVSHQDRSRPFIDKLYAAAAFEGHTDHSYVWLDVDSYFLKPFQFPQGPDLLINAVDKRNIGDPYGQEQGAFWKILYQYFGLENDQDPVWTLVSQENINPYFNIGMVVVNKNCQIFQLVLKALNDLRHHGPLNEILIKSQLHALFFHQALVTCAILKLYKPSSISPLPFGLNYPMHLHDSSIKPLALEDLVSIRYDMYFETHEVPSQWHTYFAGDREKLINTWYYE